MKHQGIYALLGMGIGSLILARAPLESLLQTRAPTSDATTALRLPNPDDDADAVPVSCLARDDGMKRGCARYGRRDDQCAAKPGTFAFLQGSCFTTKAGDTYDEITGKNGTLTLDADFLDAHDVNTIARSLVFRHYLNFELPRISDAAFGAPAYSLYQMIDLQIAFNDNLTELVAKNGFLNQHQTNTTGGCDCKDARFSTEKGYLRMDLPYDHAKTKWILPKYLYAVPTEEIPGFRAHSYVSQYGNLLAVFKDSVKDRVTFTMGDSLDFRENLTYRMNTLRWINSRGNLDRASAYFEAQIWGKTGLADVKYLLANCPGLVGISDARLAQINAATNLPVYSCKQVAVNGGARFLRDRILYGKADDTFVYNETPSIHVTKASFGTNVNPAFAGNATANAAAFCDAKGTDCEYQVSTRFLSDPASGQDKNFELEWKCYEQKPKTALWRVRIPAPAEKAKFRISCAKAGGKVEVLELNPAAVSLKIVGATGSDGADFGASFAKLVEDGKNYVGKSVRENDLGLARGAAPASVKIAYQCTLAGGTSKAFEKTVAWEDGRYAVKIACGDVISVEAAGTAN